MKTRLSMIFLALWLPIAIWAQGPKVSPTANYYDKKENVQLSATEIEDGEAPLEVTFVPNTTDLGELTASYEWHFKKQDNSTNQEVEIFVRYEEETQYTFTESGTYYIYLKVTFSNGDEVETDPIKIVIAESKLEFPNAFSPNGDGANETFHAKTGWKNIVEFKAYIFNRWGQKLFEWSDPAQGWNGKFHGKDVPDGVYFLLVKAKGSDGIKYNIRKDVNLLRGYTSLPGSNSSSSTTP